MLDTIIIFPFLKKNSDFLWFLITFFCLGIITVVYS
jgi:hypothetical protein